MTTVKLEEELHSNTRRTRITYRGLVDGRAAAVKCYRKPLFGLIHWIRALRRGKKIRRVGGPVPPIVFAGWIASEQCFGYGTAFLEGHRPLRVVLTEELSRSRQMEIIGLLGRTMADAHKRGIEQPDGNLTNFLMGAGDELSMVDEDDIRVHAGTLPLGVAISNLANVAARLPDEKMVYKSARNLTATANWIHVKHYCKLNHIVKNIQTACDNLGLYIDPKDRITNEHLKL